MEEWEYFGTYASFCLFYEIVEKNNTIENYSRILKNTKLRMSSENAKKY